MNFRFLTPALSEISDASEYYENEVSGLGIDFIDEVDSTIHRILKYPRAWSKISDEFRHCNLRRFPYTIIYHQPQENEVLIVSVFHQSRKPNSWKNNLK